MSLSVFTSQALSEFNATAAIAPSSRFLAEAMVEPLPMRGARTVVEFGPGTGVMTQQLLKMLPRDGKLLSFEVNPRFVEFLGKRIGDPRLEVILRGAETVGDELRKRGIERADAVLSSLGLTTMPADVLRRIFRNLAPVLDGDSVFTQFQYVHRMGIEGGRPVYFDARHILRRHFQSVNRRTIIRNLPPAFVYECRQPR